MHTPVPISGTQVSIIQIVDPLGLGLDGFVLIKSQIGKSMILC